MTLNGQSQSSSPTGTISIQPREGESSAVINDDTVNAAACDVVTSVEPMVSDETDDDVIGDDIESRECDPAREHRTLSQ